MGKLFICYRIQLKFRPRVRLKPPNDRDEFELYWARCYKNIADIPFALGHETHSGTSANWHKGGTLRASFPARNRFRFHIFNNSLYHNSMSKKWGKNSFGFKKINSFWNCKCTNFKVFNFCLVNYWNNETETGFSPGKTPLDTFVEKCTDVCWFVWYELIIGILI